MPSHSGPNTFGEENLVLGYDLKNPNSFKGEPTVNLIPNPSVNSRFAAGNGWRTYNTAQYNSNTYFSIGTIESVIDNVVTMATIDRPIYNFDVLTPETTGGGVTAGSNYFVKKISDNQFTLHTYNSSQDGTQGYINPDTRMRKVHDSIAFDERIEINSDAFPTSWWGPPHIPNMCYTKELRYSGGPNDDSSFMRIHLTRTEGSQGGMAYGVYPQVELGDQVTLSFWARSSMVRGWSWSAYFGGGFQGASGSINSTEEWQRFEYTWTASNTFGFYIYFWPGNPNVLPYYVDLADIQAEVNKGHATTFTLTERTATDSLIDITGNNTIDISNVSFDSNEQITFDGTDDFAVVQNFQTPLNNRTVELVTKINQSINSESQAHIYGNSDQPGDSTNDKGVAILYRYNSILCYISGYDPNATPTSPRTSLTLVSAPLVDDYYHIVITHDNVTAKAYVNGELVGSKPCIGSRQPSNKLTLGSYSPGYSTKYNGEIPIVKVYSKSLTASEIKANFNAVKGRFNIA